MDILYLSDNLIALTGPVDRSTGGAVADSGTVNARLYDESKETRTVALVTRTTRDETSAATSVQVPLFSPNPINAGDTVRVYLDDGSVKEAALSGVTPATGYMTLTCGALGVAAAAGSRVEIRTTATAATKLVIPADTSLALGDTVDFAAVPATQQRTITQIQRLVATEDADNVAATPAPNQPWFDVITLDSALGTATPADSLIRAYLGADIALSSFGTFPTSNPVAGDTAWGFRGTIPDTQVGLAPGQRVRIEIVYNGGAGLQKVTALVATVRENSG